ncbi:MAG TPA: serine/threonine-protein kinase, partial [Pseudonocardiaceae bacterium]
MERRHVPEARGALDGSLIAGRYRILRPVRSGGTATVWAAIDEVLGREVAIKEVSVPSYPGGPDRHAVREQTMREARAAGRVNHPGVVSVHDVVEHDGRPWIVMSLIRAPSLAEVIDRDGPFDPPGAARIGLQLLDALRAVHGLGVIHRDVKPSNVLLEDEHAVLTDFGIATIAGEATLTPADTVLGAPSYIAPECVHGRPASPASDLWALGATLYAAVEGRPPFRRETAMAALVAAATCDPDPLRRAGALGPLLGRLLRRDPRLRPDADHVERELRRVAGLPSAASAVPGAGVPGLHLVDEHTMPARSRPPASSGLARRWAVVAAAIGLLALAVAFGLDRDEPGGGPQPDRQAWSVEGLPADRSPAVGPGGAPTAPDGGPAAPDATGAAIARPAG